MVRHDGMASRPRSPTKMALVTFSSLHLWSNGGRPPCQRSTRLDLDSPVDDLPGTRITRKILVGIDLKTRRISSDRGRGLFSRIRGSTRHSNRSWCWCGVDTTTNRYGNRVCWRVVETDNGNRARRKIRGGSRQRSICRAAEKTIELYFLARERKKRPVTKRMIDCMVLRRR